MYVPYLCNIVFQPPSKIYPGVDRNDYGTNRSEIILVYFLFVHLSVPQGDCYARSCHTIPLPGSIFCHSIQRRDHPVSLVMIHRNPPSSFYVVQQASVLPYLAF